MKHDPFYQQILDRLARPLDPDDLERFDQLMNRFIVGNQGKLEQIFQRYQNDDRHPLLFQPEVLLIFERNEQKPMELESKWEEILPIEMLEPLVAIWG